MRALPGFHLGLPEVVDQADLFLNEVFDLKKTRDVVVFCLS